MKPPSVRLLSIALLSAALAALVAPASAQTSLWIAPGPHVSAAAWTDPANWDNATVPNAAGNLAVFDAFTTGVSASPGTTTHPGAAPARIFGGEDITVDEIRYHFTGNTTSTAADLMLGSFQSSPVFASTTGNLHLTGAGFTVASDGLAAFLPPRITVINGTLDFRNQASAGPLNFSVNESIYSGATAVAHVIFHETATASKAAFDVGGSLGFWDQSTADHATITLSSSGHDGNALLEFKQQAGAGHATIALRGFSELTFGDTSSAQDAVITSIAATGSFPPGNRRIIFWNQSTAANATITTDIPITFNDQSSAGAANIEATESGSLTFKNTATAAQAKVTGRGQVAFRDQSSAGSATIAANAILFQNDASAGSATLAPTADSALSSVEFHDHAKAGSATINLGKLGDAIFADNSDAGTAKVQFGSGAGGSRVLIQGNATTGGLDITTAAGGQGRLDISGAAADVFIHSISGRTDIELGGNSLVLSAPAGGTLSGIISGSGALAWSGPNAVLTVSNDGNTYTGATSIGQGLLRLDGGRVNNLFLRADASLGGNGTVTGLLNNQGHVRPGNSPGTIMVQGNYVQTASGALDIEIASASSYDRLVVNGDATLAGTLNLTFPGGPIVVGNTNFAFLTANTITGQFDTVNMPAGSSATLSSQLVYGPGGVSVQVTQRPFTGFGGTSPASAALGAHLDATLAGSTGDYRALIGQLNTLPAAGDLATALNALAPDRYAALAENSFLAATTQQAARDRRLATLRPGSGHGFDVFFDVGQRRTRFDAAPGLPAASAALSGGTATGAWHNDGFAFGVAVAQEDGHLDLDDTGSRADLKSVIPAVFFHYANDRWFANASAAFSRDDYDARRRVTFAGFDQTAAATTKGKRNDLAVNVGTLFHAATWAFTPQAGVLASRWQLDGFTETGAAGANLAFTDQSLRSLRTRVGLEATVNSDRFTPRLSVYWLHETGDDRTVEAGFAGAGGARYAAPGRPAAANLVQASVGFDCRLGRHAVLNLTAAGAWGDRARVTSDLSAGFRWEF